MSKRIHEGNRFYTFLIYAIILLLTFVAIYEAMRETFLYETFNDAMYQMLLQTACPYAMIRENQLALCQ